MTDSRLMKPLVNVSTATVWVIGRSSASAQLINQLSPFSHSLAFRKVRRVGQVGLTIQAEQRDCQQVIVVTTATLDFADLDELRILKNNRPDVSIVICFSSAHLGIVSYAWALDFAAYFTIDDSSEESYQIVSQSLRTPQREVLHSSVFQQWLRQYGILFEHDQVSLWPD